MNLLFDFAEFNKKANELLDPFHDFIIKNHGNPVFWIAAFFIGVAIFFLTYSTLHGNND